MNGQIRTGEQAKRSDHQDPKIVENPSTTCEEVNKAVDDINTELDPSHVIVHCGTNNLVTNSADVCITKVKNSRRSSLMLKLAYQV